MSANETFDRTLAAWLDETRLANAPDGLLDDVVARVAETPRRREWLIGDRWTWSARARQVSVAMRVAAQVAVVILVIAALLATVILVGSSRPAPPFGLARPGYITTDAAEGIVVARADGTERRVLMAADGQSLNATWSRDGLHLAFWHRDGPAGPWSLMVVDTDGKGRTLVAEGVTLREREESLNQPSNLTWSPDSRRMAFAADTPDGSAIFVVDRDRYGATKITDAGLQAIDPAWSPSGSVIAFQSGLSRTLHVVAPDGTGEHRLNPLEETALWPDWSPDGQVLAVTAFIGEQSDIFVVSADGVTMTNISHDPAAEFSPSWSPDGSRLAWARVPADGSARAWVVVATRDGTRIVEIRVPADLAPPTWSPDGSRVYSYLADDAGTFSGVIVLDPEGLAPPVRIPMTGNVGNGSWQRLP